MAGGYSANCQPFQNGLHFYLDNPLKSVTIVSNTHNLTIRRLKVAMFYHGTDARNARDIENGWRGTLDTEDNLDLSSGETSPDGWVFLADNRDYASGYGDTVFVVDTQLAQYWRDCPVTGEREYRVRAAALNEEGAWWVEGGY